jgi:hypothetical protein
MSDYDNRKIYSYNIHIPILSRSRLVKLPICLGILLGSLAWATNEAMNMTITGIELEDSNKI